MNVIIVAAGSGQRFISDTPKQFLEINNKLVVQYSIDVFDSIESIQSIVVVMPSDQNLWPEVELRSSKKMILTHGGKNRVLSVLNGLNKLQDADSESWVLIHDAARPCVTQKDVNNLIDTVEENKHGGILVKPVNDTIKYTENAVYSEKTIDRQNLRAALTPQVFPFAELKDVLLNANMNEITDEASAFEQIGYKPLLIPGRSDNIKLTYAEDLLLAEYILKKR